MTKAEKQKAYRERKKEKEGEIYLDIERQRVRGYYVPIVDRTEKEQEIRRKKVKEYVRRDDTGRRKKEQKQMLISLIP